MSSTASVPESSSTTGSADAVRAGLTRFGGHWGVLLTLGLGMVVLGVLMLAWPGATLLVLAVLFAIQLFIYGVFQIVGAFTLDEESTGTRTLQGILGALSMLVGLLFLRSPMQTLLIIGLLIGSWWLITGIIEVVTSISRGAQAGRWWRLALGVLSVAAGVVVLLQPGISLVVLEWVMAIWLLAYGVGAAIAAISLRSRTHRAAAAPSPPSTEGLAPA